MLPTPRAEALAEPVRDALRAVQRALSGPETFDPASSRRSFTIAAPDIIDLVLVPRLLARISELAPNVDLSIAPFEPAPFDRLASGELDLAIGVRIADRSASVPEVREPGLERRTLVRDRFVCFLRARKARLTLARYTQLGHILVSPTGRGPGLVDDALAKRRLTRRVALRVPHFHSALAITAESDLVLTAPAALTTLAKRFGLCTLPPPLPLPEHSVDLIWHQRFAADPGHRWLRDQIAAVARNL